MCERGAAETLGPDPSGARRLGARLQSRRGCGDRRRCASSFPTHQASKGRTTCQQQRSPRPVRPRHDRKTARPPQVEPPLALTWNGRSRASKRPSATQATPCSYSPRTWAAARKMPTRNWFGRPTHCVATPSGPTSGCSKTSTSCAARSPPRVRLDARREQPQPAAAPETRTEGAREPPRLGPRGPAPSPARSRQPRRDAPGVPPARRVRPEQPARVAPKAPAPPLALSKRAAPPAAAHARTRNPPQGRTRAGTARELQRQNQRRSATRCARPVRASPTTRRRARCPDARLTTQLDRDEPGRRKAQCAPLTPRCSNACRLGRRILGRRPGSGA